MSKDAFLNRLRELLAGIPAAERQEAIQYYEDYFADAGVENEAKVIEELGSPEKVAENIRLDLGYQKNAGGETGSAADSYRMSGEPYPAPDSNSAEYRNQENSRPASGEKRHSGLWIVVAICTCWLWGPILIGLVSVLFALAVTILAVVFAFGIAALALLIVAVVLAAVSVVKMFISPAGGLLLLGGGLMLGGIAILGVMLVIFLFGKAVPACFRGIGSLWRGLFRRGGNYA